MPTKKLVRKHWRSKTRAADKRMQRRMDANYPSLFGGCALKLKFEDHDAMLRYSTKPWKTVFKDI
jgi:hypothetical protein